MLIEIAKIQFIGTQEVKSFNKPCGHEPYWQLCYWHKACKLVPLCFTNTDETAQNQLYLRKLKKFVSYTVSFLKNDAKNARLKHL